MIWRPLLAVALLVGCENDPKFTPEIDEDGDGWLAEDDCDDSEPLVNPDMTERCDEVDNDCDGDVDEGYDDDGDGYLDADACPHGDDCNDSWSDTHPGAEETPYDGLDQDCDGSDLADVDGDGHDAVKEGGDDCDDDDPGVSPSADEVPYDGIDQDCDEEDLVDVDGDGHDGLEAGGDDCDDEDAAVSPSADESCNGIDDDCDETVDEDDAVDIGTWYLDADGDGYGDASTDVVACDMPEGYAEDATDCDDEDSTVNPGTAGDWHWWNAGVDSDCDGEQDGLLALSTATATIEGDSTTGDLLGFDMEVCDFDADGLADLVVAAPFADSYAGGLGIFYGADSATWSGGMTVADAGTVIGSDSMFLGMGVACADLDGDGYQDLVTARGEIDYYSTYDTDWSLVIWYGDGTGFGTDITEADGGVELTWELGVKAAEPIVNSMGFTTGDLDGDGAAEVVVRMRETSTDQYDVSYTLANGASEVFVLPGGSTLASGYLADHVEVSIAYDSTDAATSALVVEDLDGDGYDDLYVGQAAYDATGSATEYPGRADFLSLPSVDGSAVSELAWAGFTGSDDQYFGYIASFGDFSADGLTDGLVVALTDGTTATEGGALYVFDDVATVIAGGTGLDAATEASAVVAGDNSSGYLGASVAAGGDIDGDGAEDVLVRESGGGEDGYGRVWVLSGAALSGVSSPDDVALLAFDAEADSGAHGNALALGDLDGDGTDDFAIADYAYYVGGGTTAYGQVWIFLSSDLGY